MIVVLAGMMLLSFGSGSAIKLRNLVNHPGLPCSLPLAVLWWITDWSRNWLCLTTVSYILDTCASLKLMFAKYNTYILHVGSSSTTRENHPNTLFWHTAMHACITGKKRATEWLALSVIHCDSSYDHSSAVATLYKQKIWRGIKFDGVSSLALQPPI